MAPSALVSVRLCPSVCRGARIGSTLGPRSERAVRYIDDEGVVDLLQLLKGHVTPAPEWTILRPHSSSCPRRACDPLQYIHIRIRALYSACSPCNTTLASRALRMCICSLDELSIRRSRTVDYSPWQLRLQGRAKLSQILFGYTPVMSRVDDAGISMHLQPVERGNSGHTIKTLRPIFDER